MAGQIKHYGVKGMKWGVRKDRGPTDVILREKPGSFTRSSGGARQAPSTDALSAQIFRQKAKISTTDSLSNDELQKLVTRMNLEQQYSNLKSKEDRRGRGSRFVNKLLGSPLAGKKAAELDTRLSKPVASNLAKAAKLATDKR